MEITNEVGWHDILWLRWLPSGAYCDQGMVSGILRAQLNQGELTANRPVCLCLRCPRPVGKREGNAQATFSGDPIVVL